jgi:hypothetical protein
MGIMHVTARHASLALSALLAGLLTVNSSLCAQPDSVYLVSDNVVVVEAEDLPHSSNWTFSNTDSYTGNYTGRGYVTWNGPTQTCAALGEPEDTHHNDLTGACQGDPADWLRVPVYIQQVGTYITDLHNLHLREDGDNDVWTHVVDWPPTIVRVGSHHPGAFDWLSWGPPTHSSWGILDVPKVYVFYVAGRSRGFSVDRISIYRKTGPDSYPPAAHDLATPVSTKVAMSDVLATDTLSRGSVSARRAFDPTGVARMFDLAGRPCPRCRRGPNTEPAAGVYLRADGTGSAFVLRTARATSDRW